MSGSVVKKCRNCDFQAEHSQTGPCPRCGKQAGYNIIAVINEVVEVSDVVKTYKNSMKNAIEQALTKYSNLEKQFKDNQKALNGLNNLKNSLKSQEPALMKIAEKDAHEQATKTFTMDAIIGTEEQRKEYIEKNVKSEIETESEKTVKELMAEMIIAR